MRSGAVTISSVGPRAALNTSPPLNGVSKVVSPSLHFVLPHEKLHFLKSIPATDSANPFSHARIYGDAASQSSRTGCAPGHYAAALTRGQQWRRRRNRGISPRRYRIAVPDGRRSNAPALLGRWFQAQPVPHCGEFRFDEVQHDRGAGRFRQGVHRVVRVGHHDESAVDAGGLKALVVLDAPPAEEIASNDPIPR